MAEQIIERVVRDPFSAADMAVGQPLALGLYQDWTLVHRTMTSEREGILLAVRPHRYHPFVTERFGFREGDNAFVVWSGSYHPTLAAAVAEYHIRGGNSHVDGIAPR